MPIYEYACGACGHRADILHGINDAGPNFCLECGAEGTMRKGFAPPAIVFKGSGWAKKDRSSGTRTKAAAKDDGAGEGKKGEGSGDSGAEKASTPASTPAAGAD